MRISWLAGLIALAAVPAMAQEYGSAGGGEALALSVCSNCHLVREGQRNAPMDSVPSFDAIVRNPALPAERLRELLSRPHWPMPNLELSRQQIEDSVSYLLKRRAELGPGRS